MTTVTSRTLSVASRLAPVYICSAIIIFYVVQYYFPIAGLLAVARVLSQWNIVATSALLAMAFYNIVMIHAQNLRKREMGRLDKSLSLYLVVLSVVTMVIGSAYTVSQKDIVWFLMVVSQPAEVAVYAMNILWAASAMYRAFKVRTAETAVLLVVGILTTFATIAVFPIYLPGIQARVNISREQLHRVLFVFSK